MPILGTIASQVPANFQNNSFESIATVSVGAGGTSTIDFTSVPQTYKHLQIRYISKNDVTANTNLDSFYISFNGVGGSSYSWYRLEGLWNGTVQSYGLTSTGNIWIGPHLTSHSSWANMFSPGVIEILDYADTNKFKAVRKIGGATTNGAGTEPGEVALNSGSFQSTSAITSISLSRGGSNLAQYSHFALYGIKG
jgi:hypothetical protein